VSAAALLAALVAAAPGPADLDLTWRAPAGCPDAREVELRVADLVGRALAVGPGAALVVEARVAADDAGFTAEVALSVAGAGEVRHLSARGCEALADAVVVIVALAVEDHVPAPPPAPAQTPTATAPAPAPAAAPRVIRPRPPKPRPPPPAPGALGLEAGVSAHLALPDPGLGAGGAVILVLGPWRGALGGVVRGAGRVETAAGPTADLAAWAVSARVCRGVPGTEGGLAGCLGTELGRLRGTAGGTAMGDGATPWWWVTGGLELELPLALGARCYLRADLAVAMVRQGMTVLRADGAALPVYDPPAVSGLLGFGVAWSLVALPSGGGR
jgi:hypothetical protein